MFDVLFYYDICSSGYDVSINNGQVLDKNGYNLGIHSHITDT